MRDTDIKCWCGGEVKIKDWHRNVIDREFRYEAYCAQCGACDPNGYSAVAKTLAGARGYFEGLNARLDRPGGAAGETHGH